MPDQNKTFRRRFLKGSSCAIDLFAPEVAFPLCALAFLAIGLGATLVFKEFQATPKGILVYLAGLGAYFAGTRLVSGWQIKRDFRISNALIALSGVLVTALLWFNYGLLAVIGPFLPVVGIFLWKNRRRYAREMAFAGLALYLVNLSIFGIPILNDALRAEGFNPLWILSLGLFLLGYALRLEVASPREIGLLTCSGLIFLLGGYRGPLILLFLTLAVGLYHRGLLKNRHVFLCALGIIAFVVLFGWWRQSLGMAPLELITYRLGYTYARYDQTVNALSPQGLGSVLRYVDPRYKVGELTTGHWRSTNSALFGILWTDGEIAEVLIAFFGFGVATKLLFSRRNALYGPWCAYLLLGVEAGIDLNYAILAPFLLGLLYRE